MKIKKLIIENLNSLYGRWCIDFTDPAFEPGVFAITGPTGSGKTTILDAMSLALYAATPRFFGAGTRSASEISEVVSKGANSCLAELTFQIGSQEYMASFSFASRRRRSANGERGDLADKFQHKLSADGKVIEDKTDRVKAKIQEITGFDKTQFCRAVILAQGQFDSFLKAGNDKAEILEQITGTEIYSNIAAQINRTANDLISEIKYMEAELAGINMFPSEVLEEKKAELIRMQNAQSELTVLRKKSEDICKIFDRMTSLKSDLKKYEESEKILQAEIAAFAPDDNRLSAGKTAAALTPAYRKWMDIHTALTKADRELFERKNRLPSMKKKMDENAAAAESARLNYNRQVKEFAELAQLLKQVRAVDHDIAAETEHLKLLIKSEKEKTYRLKIAESAKTELLQKQQSLAADNADTVRWLSAHAGDVSLPEKKASWIEKLSDLKLILSTEKTLTEKIKALKKKVDADTQKAADALNEERLQKNSLADLEAELKRTDADLKALLKDRSKAVLEEERNLLIQNISLIQEIRSCEKYRKELKDGVACPVCGSTEHPLAHGNIPELSGPKADLDKIQSVLKKCAVLETEKQKAEQTFSAGKEKYLNLQNTSGLAAVQAQNSEKELHSAEDELSVLTERKAGQIKFLNEEFLAFEIKWNGSSSLPDAVTERINLFRSQQTKHDSFSEINGKLESELSANAALTNELNLSLTVLSEEINSSRKKLSSMQDKRVDLFQDQDPEIEEKKAVSVRSEAEQKKTSAENAAAASAAEYQAVNREIEERNIQIQTMVPDESALHLNFVNQCSNAFITEEIYLATVLEESLLNKLSIQKNSMEERKKNLDQSRQSAETEITALMSKLSPDQTMEKANEDKIQIDIRLTELNQSLGALRKELDTDADFRKHFAEKKASLEEKKKTSVVWSELNALIGTGSTFRRIAQGFTLEHLLVLANQELRKMNGRYQLLCSVENPLDIDVVDHEQGDTIRTSSNLSGGERFLVSLSLALGLSAMASEKISIDSLFLDEGFGTLDEDALDMVLQTLSSLRGTEGKQVGVITHVQAVSESLPTVIHVSTVGGGKSELSGPGIRRDC